MVTDSLYYKQVQLLMQVLPLVADEDCFALKGGTAINLFIRDMPRLSVDIDLVYLPKHARDEAIAEVMAALDRIGEQIQKVFPTTGITKAYEAKPDALRLVVSKDGVQIKIELSPVLRQTVYEPVMLSVHSKVEDEFGYAEIKVVTQAELYAGKICAALDRQHPRDLFDIKYLLESEGFSDEIRKAFLVYLISHPRPIAELLSPQFKDIKAEYEGEFRLMNEHEITVDELEVAREVLLATIRETLTDQDRQFLQNFKALTPDWDLLDLENVEYLPAVQWKIQNLKKMKPEQHQAACNRLAVVLQEM